MTPQNMDNNSSSALYMRGGNRGSAESGMGLVQGDTSGSQNYIQGAPNSELPGMQMTPEQYHQLIQQTQLQQMIHQQNQINQLQQPLGSASYGS